MKTFTLDQYEYWRREFTGTPEGSLLKRKLNYGIEDSPIYQTFCDCVRAFASSELKAYDSCDDCLGKGIPPIPIGELTR